jgi:hypothetical protein
MELNMINELYFNKFFRRRRESSEIDEETISVSLERRHGLLGQSWEKDSKKKLRQYERQKKMGREDSQRLIGGTYI